MQNEIVSVAHEQGQFLVICTQKASAFQIDIDGMIFELGQFAEPASVAGHYVYDLSAISSSFGGLDFAVNHVQIKALGSEFVLESEPFVVT